MTVTLKATSPADLIAATQAQLGFVPTDSMVLVTLQGNTMGATLRMDLPPHDNSGNFDWVKQAVRYVKQDVRATRVFAHLYTLEAWDVDYQPRADLIAALMDQLEFAGMPLVGVWQVTDTQWNCWSCPECDQRGPLTQVAESQILPQIKTDRVPTVHNPGFDGDPEEAKADLAARIADLPEATSSVWASELEPLVTGWSDAIEQGQTSDEELVHYLALMHSGFRDWCIARIFSDDMSRASIITTFRGELPTVDWERIDRAQQLLRDMLHVAPGALRAPIFSVLGFIAYYKGSGTTAGAYYDLALEVDPHYTLADLLKQMLNLGGTAKVNLDPDTAYGV